MLTGIYVLNAFDKEAESEIKRSTQLDVMSDLENIDVMLGSFSRNGSESQSSDRETGMDLGSVGLQQYTNLNSEDSALINTNSI